MSIVPNHSKETATVSPGLEHQAQMDWVGKGRSQQTKDK